MSDQTAAELKPGERVWVPCFHADCAWRTAQASVVSVVDGNATIDVDNGHKNPWVRPVAEVFRTQAEAQALSDERNKAFHDFNATVFGTT